jgi:acyl-CoA synthetase (AMP-forming)/AMP-acid ligase II
MLDAKGNVKKSLTYAQLWQQSAILSTHLLKEGLAPKDRVMIVYPIASVLEYMTAFIACLRIGVTPGKICLVNSLDSLCLSAQPEKPRPRPKEISSVY